MKPDLQPLYNLLAAVVHYEYQDDVVAIKETIHGQIASVMTLFEALPLDPYKKDNMRDNEMQYMVIAKKEFEAFNNEANYDDVAFNDVIVNRFKVDAERTRIFLELRERNWEGEINFSELDF